MKKLFLLLIAALFALFGCEKKDLNSPDKPDIQTENGNAVIRMDSATVSQRLQSISENGTLTFSGLPSKETPKADDIICSAPAGNAPYGFLYRVTKVSTKDGNTVIETREASLEEVIENADVSQTISLDDRITGIFDEDGKPLEYTSSSDGLRAGVASKNTITIGKTFEGGSGSLKLAGSLTISNMLEFDINIKKWSLQYLKFAYTVGVDLEASVTGELQGGIPLWNVRIATIKLTPITILVAGVPVVVVPEIPIYLKGDLNGSIKGEFKLFDSKNSLTLGLEYKDSKLNGIFNTNSKTTGIFKGSKVVIGGELKVSVVPGVSLLLYNSRNMSFGATAGAYGKLSLTQTVDQLPPNNRYGLNPEIALNAGCDIGINGNFKIFKLNLIDFELTRNLFDIEIYKLSVFPQFSDITLGDVTENSAKVYSSASILNTDYLFPVYEYGFCISKNPLPNINDDHYNLGILNSSGNLYINFTNLNVNTTYYVCPYFVNWFGAFYGKVKSFSLVDWVLINGVKWATRNVGAPHTFVQNPENYGSYYQWNRGTTNFLLYDDYYNSNYPYSTSWLPANDPSPAGYHVPTSAEIQSLTNTAYVTYEWTTRNGVYGGKFTDKANGNSIFMPAAGYRNDSDGKLLYVGSGGNYWSSTKYDSYNAYHLFFYSGSAYWNDCVDKPDGFPIRPVAE